MRLIADGVDRPRRRPGARRAARLQRPAAPAAPRRRGRRGADRARPRAAGADRARADRDDDAADGGRRVRGRLLEHPAVQRHGARRCSRSRRPRCGERRGPAPSGARRHPRCGSRTGCRSARTTCSGTSPRPRCPGWRRSQGDDLPAHAAARARARDRRADARGRPRRRAASMLTDLRDLTAAIARCRRLLDLDADPEAIDELLAADPALRAARPPRAGPPRAALHRRRRARAARGARPAGVDRRGAHARRPASRSASASR